MTNNEKIGLLLEMMELDEGTISADTMLTDIKEWDSMAMLSFIVLMDEEFSKKLSGKEIKEFKTIQDLLDFMG